MDELLLEFIKNNLVTLGLVFALLKATIGDNKVIRVLTDFIQKLYPGSKGSK